MSREVQAGTDVWEAPGRPGRRVCSSAARLVQGRFARVSAVCLTVSCRGDQHDPSVVEYFLTENLLAYFNQILQQRSNRRGNVATQVLQTLSILIQNVRNQQTVYYLFSNNHINEIVTMRFDFDDDEVLVSVSCTLTMWALSKPQLLASVGWRVAKQGCSLGMHFAF